MKMHETGTLQVQCENVSKRYGQKSALHHLNLDIQQTGVVGILGPNGSGKSTLFRLLTGLSRPSEGRIKVFGASPGWRNNEHIAYLPDRAKWYENHSVAKAFDWGTSFLPNFDETVARNLAQWMNVDLSVKVAGMSRGEAARLMLIMCLARDVPLVILDEPFAGIDVVSRERIISGIIDFVSERACTLLISTHEISEAESLFDHAVFLKEGTVALRGDVDELRSRYGSMKETFKSLY